MILGSPKLQVCREAGRVGESHLAQKVRIGHQEREDPRAGQEKNQPVEKSRRNFPSGGKDSWKGPGGGMGLAHLRSHGSLVWLHTVRRGWGGHQRGQQGLRTGAGTKHSGLGTSVCLEIGMGSVRQGGSHDLICDLERSLQPCVENRPCRVIL